MNLTTLIRMLQDHHDKGQGDVPVAVHVSAEAGWALVPLLDQVGALGSLDEPDAILLAAQADQLNPYDDADPPSGTARLFSTTWHSIARSSGPARYRNEAGQFVEDDDVPEEDWP